jgi:DNA-binding NarL/FixJ family response regulator
MSLNRAAEAILIGLVSDEPIRLEGLASILEQSSLPGKPQLLPVPGSVDELLEHPTLEYLVLDLHSSSAGIEVIDQVRRARPSIRPIVIGPEGNDELVLQSIVAGARAYLDLTADADAVRNAIETVTAGSIWAPRRLLSKLIDRLLKGPDTSLTNASPHLTDREHQVLECIMQACSNREIAEQLGIEERTVKAHVGRLMRKTGTVNRTELSMRELNHPIKPSAVTIERRRDERRKFAAERRLG